MKDVVASLLLVLFMMVACEPHGTGVIVHDFLNAVENGNE